MDDGEVLYNRIRACGYEECQGDVLAVSGMAEDIRDALLDYQVGGDKVYAPAVSLKLGHLANSTTMGDLRPELQADWACGTYLVTGHQGESTITITNPPSPTPSHFIHTDMKVEILAFTGNILLVLDSGTIATWWHMEEGVVDGVLSNGRADRGHSIWSIPRPTNSDPRVSIEDQIVTMEQGSNNVHVYHAGAGELFEPTQAPTHPRAVYHSFQVCQRCQHYPHYRGSKAEGTCPEGDWQVSSPTLQKGWAKDPEGKHRVWVPPEWRPFPIAGWFHNITTLRIDFIDLGTAIIMF